MEQATIGAMRPFWTYLALQSEDEPIEPPDFSRPWQGDDGPEFERVPNIAPVARVLDPALGSARDIGAQLIARSRIYLPIA